MSTVMNNGVNMSFKSVTDKVVTLSGLIFELCMNISKKGSLGKESTSNM